MKKDGLSELSSPEEMDASFKFVQCGQEGAFYGMLANFFMTVMRQAKAKSDAKFPGGP